MRIPRATIHVFAATLSAISTLSGPKATLDELAHWGRLAASTYQRFEDWANCTACQHADISNITLAATWSTALPAFSRGFVAIDHTRTQIIIAFRGTTHIMDALSDAQILQTAWPPLAAAASANTLRSVSRVHTGFLLSYLSARPHIIKALERSAHLGYTVRFVGHSLGAAQAALAYVDYRMMRPNALAGSGSGLDAAALVTFGSPRVGNAQFSRLLNSGNTLRVVHESDIVVHLPNSIYPVLYAHGGQEVWALDSDEDDYDEDSMTLVFCEPPLPADKANSPAPDRNCSAGVSPLRWNIQDHMVYPGMHLGIPQY
ncbi:hypothetical protein LPJ66_000460 [Kickxella alabastrina]|uniref:Uncharacterized protein n=1 Tax=Kickxella alabastrina TaxID=61397 RepID=A0ACC1IW01_9FUNG|nr:hypothetical protein LPJ66_000460 [Kickxella alabastrina]